MRLKHYNLVGGEWREENVQNSHKTNQTYSRQENINSSITFLRVVSFNHIIDDHINSSLKQKEGKKKKKKIGHEPLIDLL